MAHDPIQFGSPRETQAAPTSRPKVQTRGEAGGRPRHLDLKKDTALTIHWSDGRVSIYPIPYLRRMSPSADARKLREDLAKNPLTVLPGGGGGSGGGEGGGLTATKAEMVGNYALRVYFSDGHDTGIYSWDYLRSIDPNQGDDDGAPPDADEHVKP